MTVERQCLNTQWSRTALSKEGTKGEEEKKEKEEGKTGERRRGSAAEKNTGIKEAERDGVQTY